MNEFERNIIAQYLYTGKIMEPAPYFYRIPKEILESQDLARLYTDFSSSSYNEPQFSFIDCFERFIRSTSTHNH